MTRGLVRPWLVAGALLSAACAPAALAAPGAPAPATGGAAVEARLDPRVFVEASKRLAELRASASRARTEEVTLELDAPYMPSPIKARGVVAANPPGSLRMIMLGPGGTTAMDLWMGGGRFRFDVPALGKVIRGEPSDRPETRRGLPVDFLRWWMFQPLGGRLLAARMNGPDLEVLLDEAGRSTTATLRPDGSISAHRRWVATTSEGAFAPYEEEWLEASRVGCAKATYRQKSTSLKVAVTCDASSPEVSDEAFEEPLDEAGRKK